MPFVDTTALESMKQLLLSYTKSPAGKPFKGGVSGAGSNQFVNMNG